MHSKSDPFPSGSHKFSYESSHKILSMEVSANCDLGDMLQHFTEYLKACGFFLDELRAVDFDDETIGCREATLEEFERMESSFLKANGGSVSEVNEALTDS